ncbi:MAG: hypothetical protein JKY60_20205, partial [Kordiimonadaceae bacterium]|nr:hypothetical protein [Kordiimonadaceae bacterium]
MATNQEITDLVAAGTALKTTFEAKRDEIDAAVDSLNTAKANIVTDEVATAQSKTNAATDAAAVALNKTNSDNDAAAVAVAIGSIDNAIVPKLPMLNLLKDGGRFAGTTDHI